MQNLTVIGVLFVLLFSVSGCAITEPDDRDTARVRAAVRDGEAISISNLASDLGISEVAVVAALPESMRVKLPTQNLYAVLEDLCTLAPVHVFYTGAGVNFDMRLELPMRVEQVTADQIVLHSETNRARIRMAPADLVYLWLLHLPCEDGDKRSVGFYGSGGERIMTWQVTDKTTTASTFDAMWDRYSQ